MTITSTDAITEQATTTTLGGADAVARIAHEFAEAIRSEGNINVVFGAPMALDKHKIIPVARIEIGFGGAVGGSNGNGHGLAKQIGSLAQAVKRSFGAGGGGGIKVVPIGFIHEDGERVLYRAIAETDGRQNDKHRT